MIKWYRYLASIIILVLGMNFSFELLTMPSTIANIVGAFLFLTTFVFIFSTKCLTKNPFKK